MANVITIGTIGTVTSASAGTIKDLAGNTITYSDATLATRFIDLTLGEYVIFAYDGVTTTNICSLADIYSQGLTDANFTHLLTTDSIMRSLRINNCCASKKGAEYIEKFDKNIPCDNLLEDAEMMVNLIDSIVDFVPKNQIISGKQATYLISVTSTANSKDVSLNIGAATYAWTSLTSTDAMFASDIAYNINILYPQSFPYYAEASGANVIISGSTFSTANAVAVSGSTTNGTITFLAPATLASGTAGVLQGENGITNGELQTILDKLNNLCATPCQEVVNLSNESADRK